MVIVKSRHYLLKDSLVFFPHKYEIERLTQNLSINEIVRICQAEMNLTHFKSLVKCSSFKTMCIDLSQNIDLIYHQMDDKSCRYEIRKAEKIRDILEIKINDPDSCSDFQRIYNEFVMLNKHTHRISERRFWEYKKVADVWVIYYEKHAICGHLIIRDEFNKRVRLIFSASNRLQNNEIAKISGFSNRYLHWQEIQHYKKNDFMLYDFGGIGDGTDSIAKFKLSFGGLQLQEYNYVFAGPIVSKFLSLHDWLNSIRKG
jgi:hypothetical protein